MDGVYRLILGFPVAGNVVSAFVPIRVAVNDAASFCTHQYSYQSVTNWRADIDLVDSGEEDLSVVVSGNRLNAPLFRRIGPTACRGSGFGRARSVNATGKRSHAKRRATAAGVLKGGFLMEDTPPGIE